MPEIGHGRDLFGPENLLLKQPVVLLEIMRRFSSPSVPPRPECVLAREMNPVNIASDHIRQYPAGQSPCRYEVAFHSRASVGQWREQELSTLRHQKSVQVWRIDMRVRSPFLHRRQIRSKGKLQ
jgi:hypothetical protein